MTVPVEKMIKDVRVAVDMNATSAALLEEKDIDTLSFDEIVRSKLTEAVRRVGMEAPLRLLEQGHHIRGGIFWETDGKGWIILPDDFMRLITFRMSDWSRPVSTAISVDDPVYRFQSSRWKGIFGNPEWPVVAIVNRAEGKVLEFYSSRDDSASVEQAIYLPFPIIDEYDGIDISRDIYKAAVYRAAALTLVSIGDQNYETMLNISKSLLI